MGGYGALYSKCKPTLEEYGVDVDRLMPVTGLSERETVAWLHHTVVRWMIFGLEDLYEAAAKVFLEAREGIEAPEPIGIESDGRAKYEPEEWSKYFDQIDARLVERRGNALTKYINELKKAIAILTKGPDSAPLAYDFVLRVLDKHTKQDKLLLLLPYVHNRTDFDALLRHADTNGAFGVQVSGRHKSKDETHGR